jgi:small subunit ribosomal protein S27Ae
MIMPAKPHRKRKPVVVGKFYSKKGDNSECSRHSCPKCGKGVYMAKHKLRSTCGKCGYTEFESAAKNAEKQ